VALLASMKSGSSGIRTVTVTQGELTTSRVTAEPVRSSIVSSVSHADGSIRVTIETTSQVRPGAGLPSSYTNDRMRQAIGQRTERVADGVGRVVSAETMSINMPDPSPHTAGRPWTVTAPFVLTCKLA
jgi:hypothetical protein